MKITFDPAKDEANQAKHGVPLSMVSEFEWIDAVAWEDVRRPYGEARMVAIGYIGLRLYVIVYVDRDGTRRIISLRKANSREVKFYAKA